MRRWLRTVGVVFGVLGAGVPAYALPGEGWLDGENILLAKMVAAHMEEITQLTTIINNTRETVSSVNETLALARAVRRAYEMVIRYSLADLERDAKRGLYEQFPELERLDVEVRMAVDNAEALDNGGKAFFGHRDRHDPRMEEVSRRMFSHGYKATIWPMLFPDALKFRDNPSPAEALVQQYFIHSGEARRRAVEQTSLAVLAGKVKAFVSDSEGKDDVAQRVAAAQTQIAFQAMQDTRDMRDFKQIEVAEKEQLRQQDEAMRQAFGRSLAAHANALISLDGAP